MISGRGQSSVDAGRLAVTTPLHRLRATRSMRSRNLKGPATDRGTLESRDHQATGCLVSVEPADWEDQLHRPKVQDTLVQRCHTCIYASVATRQLNEEQFNYGIKVVRFKPNSITLAGSELIRSWFEAGSNHIA